ncbi:MAG: carboxypeptidase-like regulatory domain-containing protein, partial [Flavobacteriales bacterium]|nr:carboxypeptidase-like regulatory domain-containing protein [Flavobacteriales bacterium]
MKRPITFFLFSLFLFPVLGKGQNCSLGISGTLTDESTGIPMSYATVYVEEVQVGVVADSLGRYTIQDLCPSTYHVQFSHIGCEGKIVFVSLKNDTTLNVRMHHHNELVD